MPDTDASWLIKVITRFITLENNRVLEENLAQVINLVSLERQGERLLFVSKLRENSQPEENSEAGDVEVPLGSE